MTRLILLITLIIFSLISFVNSTSKCKEGDDGFMYCEDISSQGQSFLKRSDDIKEKNEANSDIVFIVDESKSMCKYIDVIKNKFQILIDELNNMNANTRFALIGFGGKPRIYTAFTNDVEEVNKAFEKLNCQQGDQESGLEAIRMFIKKSNKFINKIDTSDINKNFEETDKLNWESNSSRTIILITDEDSDLPHYEEYRNNLQNKNAITEVDIKAFDSKTIGSTDANKFKGFPYYLNEDQKLYNSEFFIEPAFSPAILTSVDGVYTFYRNASPLVLSKPFQKEVDETANLIIKENIQLFMLLNDDLMSAQGKLVSNSQFNTNNPYWNELGSWWSKLFGNRENDDSSTITSQYGNPLLDNVKNTNFERDDIYVKLVERKQDKSLQGQIISSDGFCRAFNINGIISSDEKKENLIHLFFKDVIVSIKSYSTKNEVNENKKEKRDDDNVPEQHGSAENNNEENVNTVTSTATETVIATGVLTEFKSSSIYSEKIIEPTSLPEVPYRNVTVCNNEDVTERVINSDIVFIIDESVSMCKYINEMKKKLNSLVKELEKINANARIAVIGFGGKPRIYSAFTDNIESIEDTFNKLRCEESGHESGLEAIRMFLKKSKKFINKIDDVYETEKNFKDTDELEWRKGSTKTIILVTDEDSDLPIYEENRNDLQIKNLKNTIDIKNIDGEEISKTDLDSMIGYPYYLNKDYMPEYNSDVYFEPSFSPAVLTTADNGIYTFYRTGSPLVLSTAYQKEVDETAKLIIDENIQLFLLLNDNLADSQGSDVSNSQFNEFNPYWSIDKYDESDDSSTITAQYGNPKLDELRISEFKRDDIYAKLVERNQENSLQGQILSSQGFCRAFNIKDFSTSQSSKFVELFFKTVVNTIRTCVITQELIETESETTNTPTSTKIDIPTEVTKITVCDDDYYEDIQTNSDIVFIIDESPSMCKYIDPMRNKLNSLLNELEETKTNARFAVIGFGGKPRIYSAFTDNTESIKSVFNKLNCMESGQESGLETIRMFLKKSDKFINKIDDVYGTENFEDTDKIEWRNGSTKTIILVTDEDSDLPIHEENRNDIQIENLKNIIDIESLEGEEISKTDLNSMIGYPYYLNKDFMPEYNTGVFFEPSFSPAVLTTADNGIYTFYRTGSPLVLSTAYQKEVDETAKLIIDENIQLFLLINDNLADSQGSDVSNSQFNEFNPYWSIDKYGKSDDSSTVTAQYGNPNLDELKNTEFNRDDIYAKLVENKQDYSLQGHILSKKGFCRAFNMKDFTTSESEKMVELFYKNVVRAIKTCKVKEEPTPTEDDDDEPGIAAIETEVPTAYKNVTVCNNELVEVKEINSDIVFVIDESASMCKYIDPLRKKLNSLINELEKIEANARIAIIGFGGKPRIYSAFTDDVETIQEAFNKLECDASGQESGLEAIRMFLNKSDKFINKIEKINNNKNFDEIDQLEWRSDSTRTMVFVTDEDSDLPIYEENRNNLQIENLKNVIDVTQYDEKNIDSSDVDKFMGFPYYLNKDFMPEYDENNYFEPAFSPVTLTSIDGIYTFYRSGYPLVLSAAFQKEVDETAQLILSNNVQLFMLLTDDLIESQGADVSNSQFNNLNPYWIHEGFTESDGSSTITAQYGNPLLDSFKSSDFERDAIYTKLVENKQEKSLQGQILSQYGFCRAFNMKEFASEQSDKIVELFYRNIVKAVETCKIERVPITDDDEVDIAAETTPTVPTTTSTFISEYTIEPTELPTAPYKNVTVCDNEDVERREINADIVFIIDESASMCKYITAMRNKLNKLIDELYKVNANARFAVIGFAGKPRIYSAFTKDESDVENAFDKLNCQQSGQESGLEAIRMFLNKSKNFINRIDDIYEVSNFSEVDKIEWREDSTKTIILVTDEDSDLPVYEENRNNLQIENLNKTINIKELDEKDLNKRDVEVFGGFPYYLNKRNIPEYSSNIFFEPVFSPAVLTSVNGIYTFYRNSQPLVLSEAYQKEVDETAKLIIEDNIQLFMLLNDNLTDSQGTDVSNSQLNELNPLWVKNKSVESDDSSTITSQYGNPLLDSFKKTEYERNEIFAKLVERKQDKSLQGQILLNRGFCRAFNIKEFTSGQSEQMVELFYMNVVRTVKKCVIIQEPICEEDCKTCDFNGCTSCENQFKILDGQGGCRCQDGYYLNEYNGCSLCNDDCELCDSTKCKKCKLPNKIANDENVCVCKDGFYENKDGYCVICNSECATCTESGCITCVDGNKSANESGKCICKPGFYTNEEDETCITCNETCITCDSVGCLTCVDSNKEPDIHGVCVCKEGYYDNGDNTCGKCNDDCTSCTKSTCLKCKVENKIADSNNVCKCKEDYYEDKDGKCVKCGSECATCDENGCLTCAIPNKVLDGHGSCTCDDGFYTNDKNTCTPCDPGCSLCEKDKCTECTDKTKEPNDEGKCVCKDGYYDNGDNTCGKCKDDCTLCNKNKCTLCKDDHKVANLENVCVCEDGYYDDGKGVCKKCDESCKTCDIEGCTSCSNSKKTPNDKKVCECIDGFYVDKEGECQGCSSDCAKCTEDECKLCKDNLKLPNDEGVCECIDGYYDDGHGNCEKCEPNCETCDINGCITCVDSKKGVELEDGRNVCKCIDGYYDDGKNNCELCDKECTTCDIKGCLSCSDSKKELNDHKCECVKGFYNDGFNNCILCSDGCTECDIESCKSCSDPAKNPDGKLCKCIDGYYTNENNGCTKCDDDCDICEEDKCLVCTDELKLPNNDGKCVCKDGYYDNGKGECIKCNDDCLLCNMSTCTKCKEEFKAADSNNVCQCINGYYENDDGKCDKCDSECITCDKNGCTSCAIPNKSLNGKGGCDCDDGFYLNDSNTCTACEEECATCTKDKCLTCVGENKYPNENNECECAEDYYENSQGICVKCDPECKTCSESGCLTCTKPNKTAIKGKCTCDEGYFENKDGDCVKCGEDCTTCSNATTCDTCKDELKLPNSKGICTCIEHYYMKTDGTCKACTEDCDVCDETGCTLCYDERKAPVDGKCQCTSKYFNDGLGNCLDCMSDCATCKNATTCETCADELKKVDEDGICVCIDGYYDDGEGNCIKCKSECKTCDIDGCTTCSDEKKLPDESKVCICKDGFYTEDDNTCSGCSSDCVKCTKKGCKECKDTDKLPNENGLCKCKDGLYEEDGQCYVCDSSCKTCTAKNICTACSDPNKKPNDYGVCECIDGYYDDGSILCKKCDDECTTCTKDGCTTCSVDNKSPNENDGHCYCDEGFYEEEGVCKKCNPDCKSCENKDTCTECIDTTTKELTNEGICVCKSHFYTISTGGCIECKSECATCNVDGCLTCADDKKELDGKGGCKCKDEYYNDGNGKCIECGEECKTCTKDICLSCRKENKSLDGKGGCKCDDHFYENDKHECIECDDECATCDKNGCITCKDSRKVADEEQECHCIDGYYEKQNECIVCDNGCSKCTINGCTECSSKLRIPDKKGICRCKDGYYEDTDNNCKPCDIECATCNSSGKCTSCKDPRAIISDGECICQNSFINTNGLCYICEASCLKCDRDGCLSCRDSTKTPKNGRC
eukprot:jgi/Orpsp1_1/1188783/evm.model.d7180000067141.1